MFTKLLKHDFQSTWGIIGLLCLMSLGASLLGGGAMRYLVWISQRGTEEMTILTVLCILTMVVAILFIAVCGVVALLVLIWRFYKSRFTDEGYLTFTLPVTSHQILLSSMVNTVLNMLVVGITIMASLAVLLLLGLTVISDFWPNFQRVISRALQALSRVFTMQGLGYLMQMLGVIIIGFACELVVLMLSVTIGALVAKKHKILAALGVYYGIHIALSVFNASSVAAVVIVEAGSNAAATRLFWSQGLIELLIAVGGYFLMHYLVSRKLNLP